MVKISNVHQIENLTRVSLQNYTRLFRTPSVLLCSICLCLSINVLHAMSKDKKTKSQKGQKDKKTKKQKDKKQKIKDKKW